MIEVLIFYFDYFYYMENSGNNFDDFLTPSPSPKEKGESYDAVKTEPLYLTGDSQVAWQLVEHAKNNRKEATEAEELLWQNLRNHKLGEKFRRQHPVGNYIPDFVCLKKRLIIEIDGGYHNALEQKELDEIRTLELEQKYFFQVIRFTNEEVLTDIDEVLNKTKTFLQQL